MSSLDGITKVNKKEPDRIVVHSIGGVGKTTFGADAVEQSGGIFIKVEDGLDKLNRDIPRFEQKVDSLQKYQEYIKDLITQPHDFKVVVTDTLDALMPYLDKFVVDEYYKGDNEKANAFKSKYNQYVTEFLKIRSAWDTLVKKRNMEVITLVHSVVENFKDPSSEPYKRWSLNLPGGEKTSLSSLLYDWSDITLFATYDVIVDDKRGTGANRVMYTRWQPAYDAKCRYSIPDKLPFSYKTLKEQIVNLSKETK